MPSSVLLVAFIGLLLLLYAIGVPAAYSLGMTVVIIMLLPIGPEQNFVILTQRAYSGLNSYTLLAIPFFIMAGRLMNITGITDDLFSFAQELVGSLRGGLAHVNVLVSLLFSGMSGSAIADAAGLGMIEYRAMTSQDYDGEAAVGVTGASSIIGPIIPPSIPIVLYGVLAQESIGALFIAGIVPGLLLAASLMATIYYRSHKNDWPKQETSFDPIQASKLFIKAIPGLLTPAIIIGGILGGVFTPTEAAIVASAYALIIGVFHYQSLDLSTFYEVSKSTFEDSISILIIIGLAKMYAYWLSLAGIPGLIGNLLVELSLSSIAVTLILTIMLLILGTFMEGSAVILIMVPILVPLYPQLGIDPIHFGIVMVVALMYGLITPPFGLILFTLERVTDQNLGSVMRSMLPYYLPLAVVLLAIVLFPSLTLALPRFFGLL
jgi:tripartite ATP-independent transporter DctM subunit